ncbi:hypothetical protein TWF696_008419 [Orbilia brochopaga]|uniref:Uncharacterized protein n=1 Tax=Orbilia brochopaga TaxID=3140254 RepID=A0AAV9UGT0_9PEZI
MAHRSHHQTTTRRPAGTTTYVRAKPSFFDRLTGRQRVRTTAHATSRPVVKPKYNHRGGHRHRHGGRNAYAEPVYVTARAAPAPAHHYRRKPTLGDKISGIIMRIRGTLTGRPGLKAAGARRQHGTDGRGSRRSRHYY